ncbi:MAG TPA: serine hydrolase domain-containing protein [Gammaproteobacteria bacterium]|nr:serine hydrolase domain-containing protein [Gammaproteobacteria bacterium]
MRKVIHPFIFLTLVANTLIALGTEISVAPVVDETRRQIERIPRNDIWWTVNGEDMLWNFKNLNKLFPTNTIYRNGPVKPLKTKIYPEIGALQIQTPSGNKTFVDFLESDESTAIAVVILHKGNIVFEHYPRMNPHEKPVYWSVTKVFVSTLVAMLEAEKKIDIDKPVDFYLPELIGSDYEGILIKNILDMATGIKCSEEYIDKSSCYYQYSMAVGDGMWDESSPNNPYEYIAELNVGRYGEQGKQFDYSGVNTFVLGWLVEKITGMQLQDALSEMIWTHIGAESDAAIFAPRYGVPVMHGGLLARPRDVARFGLLFTPSHQIVSDEQLVSDKHIHTLMYEGRPELMSNQGIPMDRAGWAIKHNIYQWDMVFKNNDIYKRGWAGQGLIVNPEKDTVAVWNGYFKDDNQSEIKLTPIIRRALDLIGSDK